jgi:hypothetical protein
MNNEDHNEKTTSPDVPTFIFIDGSYFIFYRFYSMMNWWKLANATPTAYGEIPSSNNHSNSFEITDDFIEKYRKTFIEKVQEIPSKLQLVELNMDVKSKKKLSTTDEKPIIYVGRDCKRENIWRNKLFPAYKATLYNPLIKFMGGPFFRMVYKDEMFKQGGAKYIINHQ